mmetsp:Transcript_34031/g.56353  ORF Transcript_34031/g.56353 Transcript_34031/m.56353 type:complete len:232 (+) Transcript_34031:152-847(+)
MNDACVCWICCEGQNEQGVLLPMGCACRGSSGMAHVICLVAAAKHNVRSWTMCPICKQDYTGEMDIKMAAARWELVRDRPAADAERLFVANNLAVTLKESAGDNAGALRLMEEVLEVRRRTLGDDDRATLDSIANLAMQHTEMGNFDAALPLSEEAVVAMRRALGDEDEHTLVSVAALGALHSSMGNFTEARAFLEEALEARRRILGDEQLETMNSVFLSPRAMLCWSRGA